MPQHAACTGTWWSACMPRAMADECGGVHATVRDLWRTACTSTQPSFQTMKQKTQRVQRCNGAHLRSKYWLLQALQFQDGPTGCLDAELHGRQHNSSTHSVDRPLHIRCSPRRRQPACRIAGSHRPSPCKLAPDNLVASLGSARPKTGARSLVLYCCCS